MLLGSQLISYERTLEMKKANVIALVTLSVILANSSDVAAYRYLGGVYRYDTSDGRKLPNWGTEANVSTYIPFTHSSVLGDEGYEDRQSQWHEPIYFPERGAGVIFDLGQVVEINSITSKHTTYGAFGFQDFYVATSDSIDGPWEARGYVRDRHKPGKWKHVEMVADKFSLEPGSPVRDQATLSTRYLKLRWAKNEDGGGHFPVDEIVIDAVPEPATVLMSMCVGVFGLVYVVRND